MSHLFEIRNLAKIYEHRKVLDIPSLNLREKMIYAFYGPNGAGKTTLLSILNLLLPPSTGSISYRGVDILNPATDRLNVRREMTMVTQNPYLFDTNVEGNVAYGLKMRNISKSQMRVTVSGCLARVGLSGFEKRSARELSGGEIQRVAIARALAICPQVLLLDEPTANVDMQTLSILEPLLKELNACSETSIIMATHDIDQADRLAHKVFTLQYGRIVNDETPFLRGQKRAAKVCILPG
jgi:tungstate transport system ATP-binding protein